MTYPLRLPVRRIMPESQIGYSMRTAGVAANGTEGSAHRNAPPVIH